MCSPLLVPCPLSLLLLLVLTLVIVRAIVLVLFLALDLVLVFPILRRLLFSLLSHFPYPIQSLSLGGCLKTIKSAIFGNSGRHGVPKILYFMSGGDSNDQVALPSRALRDLGVQVFSLGLGTKYNAHELKEIATAPYSDHVLATRYEILGLLRPFVTAQLCRGRYT